MKTNGDLAGAPNQHMIEINKYTELSKQTKSQIDTFIHDEFGHVSIVNETEWATPDWTIIYYENNIITTFYNVVETEILIDEQKYKVGGVNNVMTPKEFRGKGYATKLLKGIDQLIFDELNCDLVLLLCADALVPFYEKRGWYKVDCPVCFNQSTGVKLWKAETMLLSRKEKMSPQIIELKGLPW